ncbi:MAG: hypothetical protein GX591_04925 [Planctomycetes bacterium]|nr:hypothetical protein [Planctomycetota bacterium]
MTDSGTASGTALPAAAAAPREIEVAAAAAGAGGRSHTLGRLVRNTVAVGIGGNVVALGRLVVLGMILQGFGRATFGEYCLIITLLAVAEGLADFGTTDVFVREILRRGDADGLQMRVLTGAKLIQAPLAFAILVAVMLAMRYPPHVLRAAAVAGAGMVFFGLILVYRVQFRTRLTMEREVAAELASVLAMMALLGLGAKGRGGLPAVAGCHLAGRALFAGLCVAFGWAGHRLSLAGVSVRQVARAMTDSAAVGALGLLVAAYQAIDILVLSKVRPEADVAWYGAAQRLSLPLLMVLGAIGSTLYSVLAAQWPHQPEAFARTCQRGVEAVFVLGLMALAGVLAGAEFLMGLLGGELVDGADALRLLAALAVVKAFTMTLGPTLLVVRAQRAVLVLIATATAVKLVCLLLVAGRWGFVGVATAALAVEIAAVAIPAVVMIRRIVGVNVRWGSPLLAGLLAAAGVAVGAGVFPMGSFRAAVAAVAVYAAGAAATGMLRPGMLRRGGMIS